MSKKPTPASQQPRPANPSPDPGLPQSAAQQNVEIAGGSQRSDDSRAAQKKQRFIKNNQYFTICIYAGVMVLIAAIIFKCVIDFDKTKAWFRQVIGMLSPFILGALLAYVLNPMVHMFYRLIGMLFDRLNLKHFQL